MSKSEKIRQYLDQKPDASNLQAISDLAAEGIEVTANLVNQVRHDYKHKKAKEAVIEEAPLLKVKKLADEVGGVDRLLQLTLLLKKLITKGGEDGNQEKQTECGPNS